MENLPAVIQNEGALQELFRQRENDLKRLLPKKITPKRLFDMVYVATTRNPKLFECSKESWINALMKAAEIGLDCSGMLGEANIIPRKNNKTGKMEAQLDIGYQGYIKLLYEGGQVDSIIVNGVFEKDEFEVDMIHPENIKHKPYLGKEGRGNLVCAYMLTRLKSGNIAFELMTLEDLKKVEKCSPAGSSGPWGGDFKSEMQRKSVVRRAIKYLPKSQRIDRALEADNQASDFKFDVIEVKAEPGVNGLVKALEEKKVLQETPRAERAVEPDSESKEGDTTTINQTTAEPPRLGGKELARIVRYCNAKKISNEQTAEVLKELGYEKFDDVPMSKFGEVERLLKKIKGEQQ